MAETLIWAAFASAANGIAIANSVVAILFID
jgi:hypothetical protein